MELRGLINKNNRPLNHSPDVGMWRITMSRAKKSNNPEGGFIANISSPESGRGPRDILSNRTNIQKRYGGLLNTELAWNRKSSSSELSSQHAFYIQHPFSQLRDSLHVSSTVKKGLPLETYLAALHLYETSSSTIKMCNHLKQLCSTNN